VVGNLGSRRAPARVSDKPTSGIAESPKGTATAADALTATGATLTATNGTVTLGSASSQPP
jgi:hypothetical protein